MSCIRHACMIDRTCIIANIDFDNRHLYHISESIGIAFFLGILVSINKNPVVLNLH